jgi:predicted nucleic acid-binding protein
LYKALLDANVLYPKYLNDALLRLAYAGLYQVRWSEQILEEAARNIKSNRPESKHASIDNRIATMKEAFPEAMVSGHERSIPALTNHEKDRHVLAAAIVGRADVIVTSNTKHFPRMACQPYNIEVQPPDDFLCCQWDVRDPAYLIDIIELWATNLKQPPLTVEELLGILARSTPKFSQKVLHFVRSRT